MAAVAYAAPCRQKPVGRRVVNSRGVTLLWAANQKALVPRSQTVASEVRGTLWETLPEAGGVF